MSATLFALDATWRRFDRTILAGSPLRLFRLGVAGVAVAERLERNESVNVSVLTDRLLDAGAIHPRRPAAFAASAASWGLADVTVVTPQLGGVVNDDQQIHAPGDLGSGGGIAAWVTVDDGSTPPLDGATLRLDQNCGPAAARNAARPLVGTALVAFVDADVRPRERSDATPSSDGQAWLADLLWHFDDPQTGLVAPRVEGEKNSPLDLGDQPARIRSGTRVSYVPAAAILVRTEALDQIGWFDEGLRYGEDVDLVWRLDQAGWRCRYDPAVSVWHEPRVTWSARLRQHAGYGTSAAPLALRHPGALSPAHVNGWTAAAWLLAVSGRWFGGGTVALGSSAALIRKLPDVPATASMWLALRGHLLAGQQFAAATRRVWWPLVAVGALVSKRLRWVAVAAVLSDVRSTPTDVAYGWGVWTSMRRLRTWAPIVPRLSSWPGRQPRQQRGEAGR